MRIRIWFAGALLTLGVVVHAPGVLHAQTGPPLRSSWTSDLVSVHEGDIVTILVDELTLAVKPLFRRRL